MINQRDLSKFVFISNIEDRPQPISLVYSTFHWVTAQSALIFSLITGTCRVVCCKTGPDKLWDSIEKYKVRIRNKLINNFEIKISALINDIY